MNEPIIIAGSGIGGLTMATTPHEIGAPVRVLESSMARYKVAAGFAVETLNAAPRALPEGATLTPRS